MSKTPYLHIRPVYRTGETQRSQIKGNRAGLLQLRDQVDQALGADRKTGVRYREAGGRVFVLWVSRAKARWMMGVPRSRSGASWKGRPTREERYRPGEEPPRLGYPFRWAAVLSRPARRLTNRSAA